MSKKYPLRVFGLAVLSSLALLVLASPQRIQALSGHEFRAGNIISDSTFFSGSTMTIGEIQRFLDAKVPTCDTYGTKSSGRAGYPTRADWGRANGAAPPYVCLKDYRQNTPTRPAESGLCKGYTAASNQTAAEIIYYVSESCGINAKALVVLLQKEQSLITDDWPWPIQYRSATGYGCPDTAPCDAEYYGFFNQVYAAARQFKHYNQGGYNHKAYMNNYIRYNPNAACGGSTVYIQNQATAGLYNYTPYQPNQAALNNLYGTGDSCSAYGNRNFWRLFNDWFGSTDGGSYLLRTVDDSSVYLIVGNYKYPISDINIMNAISPLGPVGFVSPQYLETKTTGQVLKRLIRGEDGTVYFVDSGIKLPFTSCGLIEHYGYTCADVVTLTDSQLSTLATGPLVTRLYGTTNGKLFYAENGKKREVYDMASLVEQGIGTTYNALSEAGISHMQYGQPVLRSNVIVGQRGSGYKGLYYNSTLHSLNNGIYEQSVLASKLTVAYLDQQSINNLSKANFDGFITNNASTKQYILTKSGKAEITDPARWTASYSTVPDAVLNQLPNDTSSQINNGLVKSPTDGTVYYIVNKQKRPIGGWDDLLKLNPNPQITEISNDYIARIPTGTRVLGPGSLVKYVNDGTVYLVDGLNKKIPLTTYAAATDLGIVLRVPTAPDAVLNSYATSNYVLPTRISCNGKNYIGSINGAHEVTANMQAEFGLSYVALDPMTCANIKLLSTSASRFLLTPDGTIYYIESGKKRPFTSYNTFLGYGGGNSIVMPVTAYTAAQLPTGSIAK